jgi:hypothetical protein
MMRKSVVVLAVLMSVGMSWGATCNWNPAAGSDDFTLASNWSAAFSTASDSLRVGATTATYPNSANLARLTTGFGVADAGAASGNLNDALVVGGYSYTGNFELANGTNTAYFRSVIVGDTKVAGQADSVMTITSGTIKNGDIAVDTGYMTIGRNNTAGSALYGVGYLNVNGGLVAMDRITVGELRSGNTYAGEGHIVLQNDGAINLTCQKVFADSYVGFKLNNGDFTWIDNGSSSFSTGSLSMGKDGGLAKMIFQSADNSFGADGKGIVVFDNDLGGDGMVTFSTTALIDVTGLAYATNWVTLITAKGFTFADDSILTDASIAAGWSYRVAEIGGAQAFQVIPEPATLIILGLGSLFLRRLR